MIKYAKNKTAVNQLVKETQVVFPELRIDLHSFGLSAYVGADKVISALKVRGGYSLLLNDQYFDDRSLEEKRQSLEINLKTS